MLKKELQTNTITGKFKNKDQKRKIIVKKNLKDKSIFIDNDLRQADIEGTYDNRNGKGAKEKIDYRKQVNDENFV